MAELWPFENVSNFSKLKSPYKGNDPLLILIEQSNEPIFTSYDNKSVASVGPQIPISSFDINMFIPNGRTLVLYKVLTT